MRIVLFIYHVSSIGGGSFALLNIIKGLDNNKYKPMVLLRTKGPLQSELEKIGVEVHMLNSMSTVPYNASFFRYKSLKSYLDIIWSLKEYKDVLKKINPDIVYVNSMMLYPYLSVAKKMGYKTLIHIREHWPENEHVIQRKWAVNSIINNSESIIAINNYSASMLGGRCDSKITIVYDWIDLDKRCSGISMSKILSEDISNLRIFLYTGGIQPIKGAKEILEVFTQDMKDPRYRLVMLGVDMFGISGVKRVIKKILVRIGYKPYGEKVRELIRSDSRIKTAPYTYYIKDLLDQSYCVLSYFTIPHANLILAESVINQTVCVAANNSEAVEYSGGGKMAILFEPNNIEDFKSKVLSIDKEYSIIKNNLKLLSNNVKSLFDPVTNINKINEVLNNLSR